MDTNDIQTRIDAMPAAMSARGLVKPEVMFWLSANSTDAKFILDWAKPNSDKPYDRVSHYPKGETIAEQLDAADAFIAALPSREETNLRDFMDALGNVIDMGRESGIEVAFINPITETMKKLSENALTYQKSAAE